MVGHGWQMIEAAPKRAATPTLFASQRGGRSQSAPPKEREAPRAPRRLAVFVSAMRTLAAPSDDRRPAATQPPPRWPAG
jgi:hypothetical protein